MASNFDSFDTLGFDSMLEGVFGERDCVIGVKRVTGISEPFIKTTSNVSVQRYRGGVLQNSFTTTLQLNIDGYILGSFLRVPLSTEPAKPYYMTFHTGTATVEGRRYEGERQLLTPKSYTTRGIVFNTLIFNLTVTTSSFAYYPTITDSALKTAPGVPMTNIMARTVGGAGGFASGDVLNVSPILRF